MLDAGIKRQLGCWAESLCCVRSSLPKDSSLRLIVKKTQRYHSGISGDFGRVMVRILAKCSRVRIPMVRPNEPNVPLKRTKKVRLGIYRSHNRGRRP